VQLDKKEQKILRKFDFFKKPKEPKHQEILKKHKDELTIYGLFSLAFVMGCFTSISNSLTIMCYISGIIFGMKGALFFKTTAENLSLKAPLTYFMIAFALFALPDMLSYSVDVIPSSPVIAVDQAATPAIDIYKIVPTAPLEGVY
jgi:hypothetical protein